MKQAESLPKEIRKALFDFIDSTYDGTNKSDVMYNLHLEIEDVLWDVEHKRLEENPYWN